jgi:hypothetical protein
MLVGWLEMLRFTWCISSVSSRVLLCSLGKMSEDRVWCGVSSNVNQLEAFFMRTLFNRTKSCVSYHSLYIKVEGSQHCRTYTRAVHKETECLK